MTEHSAYGDAQLFEHPAITHAVGVVECPTMTTWQQNLVLLAVSVMADRDRVSPTGYRGHSLEEIQLWTRVPVQTLHRNLELLVTDGFLTSTAADDRGDRYWLPERIRLPKVGIDPLRHCEADDVEHDSCCACCPDSA